MTNVSKYDMIYQSFLTFPLGFLTKLTTSGMEAIVGSLFVFILDGVEGVANRSSRGGKSRFQSLFDVWLLSSKKERLDSIQSEYKLQYFGEYQVMLHRSLFLSLYHRYRLPSSESGVCCEMQMHWQRTLIWRLLPWDAANGKKRLLISAGRHQQLVFISSHDLLYYQCTAI